MESVTHRIQRAITAGTIPQSRMAELRAGTYPTPAQIQKSARELHDGAAALRRSRLTVAA
jgi:hypothetical protein